MAEKWEYMTGIFYADIKNRGAREYIKKSWPKYKPPKYTPECMIPELNVYGEKGWEVIHMEPVARVGNNGDIGFTGDVGGWSHSYFCIMKRRKE